MKRYLKVLFLFFVFTIFLSVSVSADKVTNSAVFKRPSGTKRTNVILIGDSRTFQMYRALGETAAAETGWSAKSGGTYDWMVSTGIPQAESFMKKGDSIVIAMGTNNLFNQDYKKYISTINAKAKEWKAKGVRTYYATVNPIEDEKKIALGSLKRDSLAVEFNEAMKAGLNKKYVGFIDTHDRVRALDGFTTTDGTHYPDEINAKIYQMTINDVKKDNTPKYTTAILFRNRNSGDVGAGHYRQTVGSSLVKPSTWTNPNFEFVGWSYTRGGAAVPALSKSLSSSWIDEYWPAIELYAVWKPVSSDVTFFRNYNSSDTAKKKMTLGINEKSGSENFWKRTGWNLVGWSLKRGTSVKVFGPSVSISESRMGTYVGSVYLYAVWSPKKTTVTFEPNYIGTGEPVSVRYSAGKSTPIATTFNRAGYVLEGWSTAPNAKEAEYPVDQKMTNALIENLGTKTTFYAIWTPLTAKITFYRNRTLKDTVSAVRNATSGKNLKAIGTSWSKPGYTMLGWSTNRSATKADAGLTKSFVFTPDKVEKFKDGVELYAVWRKK